MVDSSAMFSPWWFVRANSLPIDGVRVALLLTRLCQRGDGGLIRVSSGQAREYGIRPRNLTRGLDYLEDMKLLRIKEIHGDTSIVEIRSQDVDSVDTDHTTEAGGHTKKSSA